MKISKYLAAAVTAMAIVMAAVVPAAAAPAPGKHRIAFVNVGGEGPNVGNVAAFRDGMRELGYIEGRNLEIEFRWGNNNPSALPALVSELLATKPAVIVSTGGPPTIKAVKAATSTIPVVFITGDPLVEGIVTSLARPGGNLTGFSVLANNLDPKRLELLRQLLPRAKRLAMISNPDRPSAEANVRIVVEAAKGLGFEVQQWEVRDAAELTRALPQIAEAKVDALFIGADPVLGFERERIVAFARANRLPGVYFWKEFAELGGLTSFGTSLPEIYRRAAMYVDKILKGAKPGELPIELPTKFELVVNRTAAKELGIEIPKSLLQRADVVIK